MKYIRTENGRIFEKEYYYYEKVLNTYYYHGCYVNGGKIVKEADDIEELCDAIYFVEDENNTPRFVNRLDEIFDKNKKLTECCLEIDGWVTWLENYGRKGCIKGAIFTNKGIIYVAKLNDKGEFELI